MIWHDEDSVKRDDGERRALLLAALLSTLTVLALLWAIWRWANGIYW